MNCHRIITTIRLSLILAIICLIFATNCEGKYRSDVTGARKRERPVLYQPTSTAASLDLCSKERDMKLICHCNSHDHMRPNVVTVAECWIFQHDIRKSDPVWTSFSQYATITDLKFVIQTGSLTYMPTDSLQYLTNLTSFSMRYSQIRELHSYALANLTNLHRVHFNNNNLTHLHKYAFANHPILLDLNLQKNELAEIDRHAFFNLPNLERLSLKDNHLSTLHEETFKDLNRLINLHLEGNQISVLTKEMFRGLENLRNLVLAKNNLNFVGDTVFSELWSMQELDMSDNKIEKISERAFDGLNNLRKLNLRHNRLVSLEKGVFTGVPALNWLNLRENRLETLLHNNFSPILDNLLTVDSNLTISDNRFVCDCRLAWLFDLRNRTKNENLKNTLHGLKCILFDSAAGSTKEILTNTFREKELVAVDSIEPNDSFMDSNKAPDYLSDDYDNSVDSGIEDSQDAESIDGKVVQLFQIGMEHLPCPQELADPTDLPLPRESIGMREDGLFSASPKLSSHIFSYLAVSLLSTISAVLVC